MRDTLCNLLVLFTNIATWEEKNNIVHYWNCSYEFTVRKVYEDPKIKVILCCHFLKTNKVKLASRLIISKKNTSLLFSFFLETILVKSKSHLEIIAAPFFWATKKEKKKQKLFQTLIQLNNLTAKKTWPVLWCVVIVMKHELENLLNSTDVNSPFCYFVILMKL